MLAILQSEWFKLRKSKITALLLVGPLVALLVGVSLNLQMEDGVNEWFLAMMFMNFTYALLFLPLITGVLAGTICRYEHQAGGWKQLLALPVSRGRVFSAKYVLLILLVLVIQLLYLAAIYAVGTVRGFTAPFPIEIVWKSIVGGWVATLPLVALQLWLSAAFKSFAAPFAINVIFTLPTIFAINSEKIAPYYPWAQPFSMMYIGGDTEDIFFIPWEQLLTVVGGSFLLFFLCGYIYFQRKTV
ncbi:ABC transporter permease [Metasolibacillus sp.]|uniref:ABC transporter permease n=1 Tax=Metasolibacillus sp. TaxID=2703680 RepID=UPI0025CE55FC|nr:ABC transporter permease [Metasolibacillus sp.]MCT6923702.1 ABC transporter permease [Metasolibacillus sp.]MCT6940065.1 ABC transporter permease [Metasolibacillus sp.]